MSARVHPDPADRSLVWSKAMAIYRNCGFTITDVRQPHTRMLAMVWARLAADCTLQVLRRIAFCDPTFEVTLEGGTMSCRSVALHTAAQIVTQVICDIVGTRPRFRGVDTREWVWLGGDLRNQQDLPTSLTEQHDFDNETAFIDWWISNDGQWLLMRYGHGPDDSIGCAVTALGAADPQLREALRRHHQPVGA